MRIDCSYTIIIKGKQQREGIQVPRIVVMESLSVFRRKVVHIRRQGSGPGEEE